MKEIIEHLEQLVQQRASLLDELQSSCRAGRSVYDSHKIQAVIEKIRAKNRKMYALIAELKGSLHVVHE